MKSPPLLLLLQIWLVLFDNILLTVCNKCWHFETKEPFEPVVAKNEHFHQSLCHEFVVLEKDDHQDAEEMTCCTKGILSLMVKHIIEYEKWMCPACKATYISILCQYCNPTTNALFRENPIKLSKPAMETLFDACVFNQYQGKYLVEELGICKDHESCSQCEAFSNLSKEFTVICPFNQSNEGAIDTKKLYNCSQMSPFGFCYCQDCKTCEQRKDRLFRDLNVLIRLPKKIPEPSGQLITTIFVVSVVVATYAFIFYYMWDRYPRELA